MSKEEEIKRNLLGVIQAKKISSSEQHAPRVERLIKPFERANSAMYLFCEVCGQYDEVTEDVLLRLAEQGNFRLPEIHERRNYFIITSGCQREGKQYAPSLRRIETRAS